LLSLKLPWPCSRARRTHVAALLEHAEPLLKFENEKAILAPEGIAMIRKLPGLIYPVILMGDGRAGKSYLASRVLGLEDAFLSSDSAEPVTEGIDIVVWPLQSICKNCGIELSDSELKQNMHILMLDCEGGNNAMAAIRTLVNVFVIVIGVEVVFVAGCMLSEAALQNLGASLAARSLIRLDGGTRLPPQRLLFVVNKNTLNYDEDALEKTLKADQKDAGRRENREFIQDAFPDRQFFSVPLMGMPDFEDKVTKFCHSVVQDRRPLTMGGVPVKSQQLCNLLELIVKEMQNMNEVSFPSMHRCVILDGFLRPLADQLCKDAEGKMPQLSDYEANLASRDPRQSAVEAFNTQSGHVAERSLVEEALKAMKERLDSAWDKVLQINKAFGDQTKELKNESKEVPGSSMKVPLGGKGILRRVVVCQQMVTLQTRTLMIKKSGDVVEGEWQAAGAPLTRIAESAFQSYDKLPKLKGKLHKRSPNIMKNIVTFGRGDFQQRSCLVKDGVFCWWDAEKADPAGAASGCINFLINRAEIIVHKSDENVFTIKPAGVWNDITPSAIKVDKPGSSSFV